MTLDWGLFSFRAFKAASSSRCAPRSVPSASPSSTAWSTTRHGRSAWRRAHLADLEARLHHQPCLFGPSWSLADMALLPFVRQYARIDEGQWTAQPWPHLQGMPP